MSYILKNLMSNENLVYRAKIHWVIYLPSVLFLLLGFFLITQGSDISEEFYFFGGVSILVSFATFAKSFIFKITTELGVTDKRVIAKTGLISRDTIELNHTKVESYHINQSILGRILGYGTLIVNGTGGGKTPIRSIDSPLNFRKKAVQAADTEQM